MYQLHIQIPMKYKRYVNVFMLTIVHRFQSPITSSRAGISSSLEVVITSSKSEMSLKSNVSWYNAGVESIYGQG